VQRRVPPALEAGSGAAALAPHPSPLPSPLEALRAPVAKPGSSPPPESIPSPGPLSLLSLPAVRNHTPVSSPRFNKRVHPSGKGTGRSAGAGTGAEAERVELFFFHEGLRTAARRRRTRRRSRRRCSSRSCRASTKRMEQELKVSAAPPPSPRRDLLLPPLHSPGPRRSPQHPIPPWSSGVPCAHPESSGGPSS